MSDYSKTTNFTAKDALTTGDPAKVIKGEDVDTEFDNIATAIGTKSNKISGATNNNIVTSTAVGDIQDVGDVKLISGAINEVKGSDIASATTTDIGAATGNFVDVTGTTTITGLGTVQAGTRRTVQFDGSLILTYNATSLILPDGQNIQTYSGYIATFISLGSGNWKMEGDRSAKPSFSVHRNSTNQSNITGIDKIEWTTEDFDTNSDFDVATNYRFTPTVAGKYLMTVMVRWGSTTIGDQVILYLYKSGSVKRRVYKFSDNSSLYSQTLTTIVDANGTTDYFEVFAENVNRDTSNVSGLPEVTSWTGCKID